MNYNDSVAVGRLTESDPSVQSLPANHMDTSSATTAVSVTAAAAAASAASTKDCVYTFSDNCDSDDGEELKFKIKNILQAPLKDESTASMDDANTDNSPAGDAKTGSATATPFDTAGTSDRDNDDDDDRMDAENFQGFTPPTATATAPPPAEHQHRTAATPPDDDDDDEGEEDEDAGSPAASAPQHTTTTALSSHHNSPLGAAPPPQSLLLLPPIDSPPADVVSAPPTPPDVLAMPPTPAARRPANGVIPKTGKPLTYAATSARSSAAAATTAAKRPARVRAKPKPNRKVLVTMYHSQISDNTLGGIKLKLKKSADMSAAISQAATAVSASITGLGAAAKAPPRVRNRAAAGKNNRKRARRPARDSSDDDGDGGGGGGGRAKKPAARKPAASTNNNAERPADQTDWGARLPEPVLHQIFAEVVRQEGSLPAMVRLGRVCVLWNRVSLSPSLWQTLDLARWTKERFRTELRLKWLIENRCSACVDLNLSNWKITNVHCVLSLMADICPNVVSITFAGWKSFTSDDMLYMAEQFQSLRRIDLSSINIESSHNKSAVSIQALCLAIQLVKDRLTHLYLANNKLAGIPQIVTALATFCPNLILLDLSNVSTVANSHGVLHLEKLQTGCQKLKVLRITNSHITLGPATLEEQMSSPGFPDLEELSIAALSDESRLINDDYLQRILKTSSKLQLLDVRGCARLTHESMIRLPAWDLRHLFLSGCAVTRDIGSGLELIASKWAHSLTEFDLAWANVQQTIDSAIRVLAEKGSEAAISHLNLCGSSVSQESVAEILLRCPQLNSINLSSCRGLPRGVKRLMQGATELRDLREALGVAQPKSTDTATDSSAMTSTSDPSGSTSTATTVATNQPENT